ncbi:phosphoribosyl transferase-like protein [Chitinophaga skermanii]|uniref:Phosphoribosyl transferase-like protein n=1 Tax=Chitinophaga skermanii TaxID=331697 RepID=A0A327QWL0_9BACT|nr:phosphoribosyltransferase family protein [Chitinophaga skermanii]RAJ08278.1 phosphoribosyl transferase-like protein [Chitinophaga skermanii]
MNLRYSLHKIEHAYDPSFSPLEYSRFKFGQTCYAEKFAQELFDGFIAQYTDLVLAQEEIILLPSPYCAIPTASNFLCAYFKKHLNSFLFKHQRPACKESKIHRYQTYVEDYGNMDYEQRVRLISGDTYYLDKQFIAGKLCLFLDDIKITGSHEHTVNKILTQYNVDGQFIFLYFAELMNSDVHPRIENYYNYFDVQSPGDIIRIMNSASFCFNTRLVKYILLLDTAAFTEVMRNISRKKRNELLDLAISNNYHQVIDYQENISKLKPKKTCQLI